MITQEELKAKQLDVINLQKQLNAAQFALSQAQLQQRIEALTPEA